MAGTAGRVLLSAATLMLIFQETRSYPFDDKFAEEPASHGHLNLNSDEKEFQWTLSGSTNSLFDTQPRPANSQLQCPQTCTCSQEAVLSKTIVKVDCSSKTLGEIPSNIDRRVNILYLNDNRIVEVPSWISELKDLEEIDLSNNIINDLEFGSISELPNLRVLNLSNNKMYMYPQELRNSLDLGKLADINISGNDITELSADDFSVLKSLKRVTLPSTSEKLKSDLCRSDSTLEMVCVLDCKTSSTECNNKDINNGRKDIDYPTDYEMMKDQPQDDNDEPQPPEEYEYEQLDDKRDEADAYADYSDDREQPLLEEDNVDHLTTSSSTGVTKIATTEESKDIDFVNDINDIEIEETTPTTMETGKDDAAVTVSTIALPDQSNPEEAVVKNDDLIILNSSGCSDCIEKESRADLENELIVPVVSPSPAENSETIISQEVEKPNDLKEDQYNESNSLNDLSILLPENTLFNISNSASFLETENTSGVLHDEVAILLPEPTLYSSDYTTTAEEGYGAEASKKIIDIDSSNSVSLNDSEVNILTGNVITIIPENEVPTLSPSSTLSNNIETTNLPETENFTTDSFMNTLKISSSNDLDNVLYQKIQNPEDPENSTHIPKNEIAILLQTPTLENKLENTLLPSEVGIDLVILENEALLTNSTQTLTNMEITQDAENSSMVPEIAVLLPSIAPLDIVTTIPKIDEDNTLIEEIASTLSNDFETTISPDITQDSTFDTEKEITIPLPHPTMLNSSYTPNSREDDIALMENEIAFLLPNPTPLNDLETKISQSSVENYTIPENEIVIPSSISNGNETVEECNRFTVTEIMSTPIILYPEPIVTTEPNEVVQGELPTINDELPSLLKNNGDDFPASSIEIKTSPKQESEIDTEKGETANTNEYLIPESVPNMFKSIDINSAQGTTIPAENNTISNEPGTNKVTEVGTDSTGAVNVQSGETTAPQNRELDNAVISDKNETSSPKTEGATSVEKGGVDNTVIALVIAAMICIVAGVTIKKNWSSIMKKFRPRERASSLRTDPTVKNGKTPEEVPLQDKIPV